MTSNQLYWANEGIASPASNAAALINSRTYMRGFGETPPPPAAAPEAEKESMFAQLGGWIKANPLISAGLAFAIVLGAWMLFAPKRKSKGRAMGAPEISQKKAKEMKAENESLKKRISSANKRARQAKTSTESVYNWTKPRTKATQKKGVAV